MSANNTAISVTNIGKKYSITHPSLFGKLMLGLFNRGTSSKPKKDFWALKDISFDIQPGEVVGVIGPNGAGKSTLLSIISRVIKPTQGEVKVRGRVVSLLQVGTGFHPELTGKENVFFSGALLGMSKGEVKELLPGIIKFSGIKDFMDTPVKFYSSGMRMRLGFSVACSLKADIVIIDEALSVGDDSFRKKSFDKILEITKSGTAVLFVSHSLIQINKICDRAIYIDKGRLKAIGPSREVVLKYQEKKAP